MLLFSKSDQLIYQTTKSSSTKFQKHSYYVYNNIKTISTLCEICFEFGSSSYVTDKKYCRCLKKYLFKGTLIYKNIRETFLTYLMISKGTSTKNPFGSKCTCKFSNLH